MERYVYEFTPTRIVDGDTVDGLIDLGMDVLIRDRLRLYGINTPETRTRDKDEKKRGLAAKARVEELLPIGEPCLIVTRKDRKGKFGRYLAVIYVYLKGKKVSVNDLLVKENHAVEYFGGKRK